MLNTFCDFLPIFKREKLEHGLSTGHWTNFEVMEKIRGLVFCNVQKLKIIRGCWKLYVLGWSSNPTCLTLLQPSVQNLRFGFLKYSKFVQKYERLFKSLCFRWGADFTQFDGAAPLVTSNPHATKMLPNDNILNIPDIPSMWLCSQ